MAVLDFDALSRHLRQFTEQTPRILQTLPQTIDSAAELVRALQMAESPFTLAVCGQMRVGKSTLINAFVGADLAITGVTETTATINWFRHGSDEESHRFRVVWNEPAGKSEEFDLNEKHRWTGNSELAARTRFLEFFSSAEILRRVHIIDTPGSRSTIASHETTVRGFLLDEDRDLDPLFYGGVADCIVYVLPPVAHQNDSDFLGQFTSRNRLPNTTPYNSVAVLHKWETLEHPAPWEEATVQSQRVFSALREYVCEVIPVSGPLALACQTCPPDFWNDVFRLTSWATDTVMEDLTRRDTMFTRAVPECPLSPAERCQLLAAAPIAWPCFKTILRMAASRPFANGQELRDAVFEISGIGRLREFLERRFFSRSRLIRDSNVLNQALRVTDAARRRLRSRLADLTASVELGRLALAEVESTSSCAKAREFINQHLRDDARSLEDVKAVLRDLESQVSRVRTGFEAFEQDCRAVQLLTEHGALFERAEIPEILALLGAYGASCTDRLGVAGEVSTVDALYDRLDHWLIQRQAAANERRTVLNQVVRRFEEALGEFLANQDAASKGE